MRIQTLTVVVCLLAGASIVSAQDAIQGGVLGGPGWSSLTVKAEGDFPTFSGRSAMSIGAFLVTPAARGIGLEPEVLFTLKGGKAAQDDLEVMFRLTSLEVPVLLRIGPSVPQKTAFHVLVGPTFGFPLKARGKANAPGLILDEDVRDQVRDFELGLTVGAGVDVGRLRFDGRYTWGLTNLSTDTSGNPSTKSRMFTVLAGVRLW